MENISIFNWNIANPSLERARKQTEWFRKRKEDIFVLTEAKKSQGCVFIKKYFEAYGYYVIFPYIKDKEYGTMIVSKFPATEMVLEDMNFIPSRVARIKISFSGNDLEIIGVYVPSRDTSEKKVKRKKLFLETLLSALNTIPSNGRRIICGDFNVLEPMHQPRYSFFQDWEYQFYNQLSQYKLKDAWRFLYPKKQEYSWIGKTGDGYRYDHCFISDDLLPAVKNSFYLHEPRQQKLSDHSALITKLQI